MNAVWRMMGVGGPAIPNFDYTFGDVVCDRSAGSAATAIPWLMKSGTKNDEEKTPVTIFECDTTKKSAEVAELAKNAMMKAKTLILPGFLKCFDSTEHNGIVYIATEPCVPLVDALENKAEYYDGTDQMMALGIYAVANALAMLQKNNMAHGNIHCGSVYALRSGEWRLFGTEFVSPIGGDNAALQKHQKLVPEVCKPPEYVQSAARITSMDAWCLGVLIYEAYNGPATPGTDFKGCRTLPRGLQPAYTGLLSANGTTRSTLAKFLSGCDFVKDSTVVKTVLELDELSLKDSIDRDAFYRRLVTSVDAFPVRACKHIVLPKLNHAVQFGGGSATALEPLLKIGSRLSPEDFGVYVSPSVVSLFATTDHLVRTRLLSTAGEYAHLLPSPLVCDKIWPHYVLGFQSKSPEIRELSVRSLVHFAPLLNERIITNDVVKYLTHAQQDREGPIRTNATICLGMVGQYIPTAQRSKTLISGFGRMLKDPFTPSKVAALKSICTTMEEYSAAQIAEQLLPAIAPCMVEVHTEIRSEALHFLQLADKALRKAHQGAPDSPVTPSPQRQGGDLTQSRQPTGPAFSPKPMSPVYADPSPPRPPQTPPPVAAPIEKADDSLGGGGGGWDDGGWEGEDEEWGAGDKAPSAPPPPPEPTVPKPRKVAGAKKGLGARKSD